MPFTPVEERTLGRPRAYPIRIVTQVLSRSNALPRRCLTVPLLATLGILALACSSPIEPTPLTPGRSDRPRGGPTVPAPSANAPPAPWDRWPEVATFRVALERGPSQHLAGDHESETLASPEASDYPDLGPARSLPPGSAIVQRLYAPNAATPEVLFAMARARDPAPTQVAPSGAAWEFFVLSPDGAVQERGALETCARCHAEAPNQGVFGRAR